MPKATKAMKAAPKKKSAAKAKSPAVSTTRVRANAADAAADNAKSDELNRQEVQRLRQAGEIKAPAATR